jgi:catechol 2,3-dioxygenase-like lactoylglutathione lyase family enzyme
VTPVDQLFDAYDRGKLSRRGLLTSLVPLLAGAPAQAAADTMTVKTLNHVTIFVADIERSRQFYQSLFPAPVVSTQANGINLGMGPDSFLGLYKAPQAGASISHFCLGLDRNVASAGATLEQHGIKPTIRDRDGVKELYFRDPDNIQVQLQESSYRG